MAAGYADEILLASDGAGLNELPEGAAAVLAQLYQLAPSNGNFSGAQPQKRESNQRRLIANRV